MAKISTIFYAFRPKLTIFDLRLSIYRKGMVDILSVIHALRAPKLYTQTIKIVAVDVESIAVGNNAVAARCTVAGYEQPMLLKCYYRPKRNLEYIYGLAYKRREFGVPLLSGIIEYIDVVAIPWVEGVSLDYLIGNPTTNYEALSRAFDRLALSTLNEEKAHGDIKPENIIVKRDGEMVLIDWDGAWLPQMHSTAGDEIGTKAYRHPLRTAADFGDAIDDYPIAILSTTLAALAYDRAYFEPRLNADKQLFDIDLITSHSDEVLQAAMTTFVRHRDAAHYRIAMSLYSAYVSLLGLGGFIAAAQESLPDSIGRDVVIRRQGMLMGCVDANGWIIPPLFNAITIGDKQGVLSLEEGDLLIAVK